MRRRRRLGLVLLLLIVGAGAWAAVALWPRPRPPFHGPHERNVISEAEKDEVPPLLAATWGDGREVRVGKVASLHGATEGRVLAELGEPNQAYEFPVEDFNGEFRIELWNTYPPDDPRSR